MSPKAPASFELEAPNSASAPSPLAVRIAHSTGITIVCAPPGFGKSAVIREAQSIATKSGLVIKVAGDFSRQNGDSASHAALLLDAMAGEIAVFDGIDGESLQAVEPSIFEVVQRGGRIWIAIDRPQDVGIGKLLAQGHTEVIDHRSLRPADADVRLALGRVAPAFRKVVGELSQGWPVALSLVCRWAQSTETENAEWNATDIVDASGLGGFIRREIAPLLDKGELRALIHSSVVSEVDLDLVGSVDPATRRHLINASLSLSGLVNRIGNKLALQPAFRAWLQGCFDALPLAEQEVTVERAAVTLADQCRLIEAARLLKHCGREIRIADLVESGGSLRIWMDHGYSAIKELVEQAGDAVVAQSTSLQLMRCIILMKSGRIAEAESLFASLGDGTADNPASQRDREIVRVTLLVYGCGLQQETDLERFREIVAEGAGDPSWRSLLSTLSCILHTQRARFDAAQASLIDARVNARSADSNYNLMFLSLHEASLLLAKGELKLARIAIADARKRWRHEFPEDKGAETVLAALSASLEYELGQITSARTSVRRSAFRMPDSEAWFDIYAAAYEPMARIIALDHGVGPAIEALEDQRRKLVSHGLPRVANLLLNMAHVLVGEQWLREGNTSVDLPTAVASIEPTATWHEKEMHDLAAAYVLMAQGHLASAEAVLTEAMGASKKAGLKRSLLRFRLARAGCLLLQDRLSDAKEDVAQALKLGVRQDAKQAFIHHRTPRMAEVVRSIANDGQNSRSNVSRFVASLGINRHSNSGEAGRLSPREKEVLSALSEGGSDKILARVLGVSEHGVRYHLKKIYRKLEVHDRASAVHKARVTGQI